MNDGSIRPRKKYGAEAWWLLGLAVAAGALLASAPTAGGDPSLSAKPTDNPPKASFRPASAKGGVRYGRDIRRLLSDRCFQCHGPDGAKREAELRLDDRDSAVKERDGSTPIVPGDAQASDVWTRINSDDPKIQMPPPGSNKKPLSAGEKEMIRKWIDDGAEYEPHWAFVPPLKPPAPEVADPAWCRNEIDRFILSRLEAEGATPSPEADKATLLRRVTLDLTGLPPTPEELDSFLSDESPEAYERVVDRLLTVEPYRTRTAERLAAPWLDAARYADTCGIHMDGGRQIWPWRDWVLAAFRDNMPFDRFLTEQLAGDLMPDATLAQKVASGFNRNHVTTDEGGAIAEEYLVEYAVDRVSTTSSVFLGLTMGCARCHDHKFDPWTMDDFYGLFAFFNSIEEPGLYSQTPDAKRAYEPFIEVPTAEQAAALAQIKLQLESLAERMEKPIEGEADKRGAFVRDTVAAAGIAWSIPQVIAAQSSDPKVTLALEPDGSVQPSGPVPDVEDFILTLKAGQANQRLLLVEAIAPAADKGAGRAFNGNAVVTGVTLEERASGATDWQSVPLRWAWADHAQTDNDFEPGNVLDATDKLGWAIAAHQKPGSRLLFLEADRAFAASSDADLRVTLMFRSQYAQHSLGRVRVRTGTFAEQSSALLPLAFGRWQVTGPFPADSPQAAFEKAFGPETLATIDPSHNFGAGNQHWNFDLKLADDRQVSLADGTNASYVGRNVWSPDDREINVSLGSDDGFRLFVNGQEVASRQIDRSLAPNQDKATLKFKPGLNSVVLKIANTGGPAGFYFRAETSERALRGDMAAALLPSDALSDEISGRVALAWRRTFSPEYRAIEEERASAEKRKGEIEAAVPRTMVMKELEKPRETYILERGQYDKPMKSRPAVRGVPKAIASQSEPVPDRLALARWMTSPENPLVARVAANRLWEMIFGTGLVRTSEDFGLQGEYPTHPELVDYLAVTFRESGWDMRALIRSIVVSATYRQSSKVRQDLADRDADNKWLSYYPRRRLSAEQIRDLALFASGLIVEKLGGPSVKPYQPEGLWQEVAMPQSNTRIFEPGKGEDLYRRSIYTYWKRACPPPSLQSFDAPTREACVIRRPSTNTPLQALVLWNDVQYVEAARVLAARTLASSSDDTQRLTGLFRRCTGRAPESEELQRLLGALSEFRTRYAGAPADAEALLAVGEYMRPTDLPAPELAAWTMIANAVLNLHETVTQD